MIYSDSRYASGKVYRAFDPRNGFPQVGVRRVFPFVSSDYYYYVWVDGDRMDNLAYRITGSSDNWWKIMDYNPEVLDPYNIAPGTTIRIPIV
jgi:hypothetical protein